MAGTELLDRDRELGAVDGLVAQAAEGEARLVLIEGAAGIGKTPPARRGAATRRGSRDARPRRARLRARVPGCSDSQMLDQVTSETIDRILVAAAPTPESPLGVVELRHLGGALRRSPEAAGVVGSFEAEYLAFAAGPAFDPASTAAVEAQLALVRDALSPEDSGREYLNFAERA